MPTPNRPSWSGTGPSPPPSPGTSCAPTTRPTCSSAACTPTPPPGPGRHRRPPPGLPTRGPDVPHRPRPDVPHALVWGADPARRPRRGRQQGRPDGPAQRQRPLRPLQPDQGSRRVGHPRPGRCHHHHDPDRSPVHRSPTRTPDVHTLGAATGFAVHREAGRPAMASCRRPGTVRDRDLPTPVGRTTMGGGPAMTGRRRERGRGSRSRGPFRVVLLGSGVDREWWVAQAATRCRSSSESAAARSTGPKVSLVSSVAARPIRP